MINNTVLQGRLTADPELKTTSNGISVTSFCIAVDRNYGQNKRTDFINIVAWRKTAEFVAKYFRKGQMILVVGSIQTRKYEDRNGNNRTAFEVVASEVEFGEKKQDSQGGQSQTSYMPAQNDNEELPF